jgi:hypothetical protein
MSLDLILENASKKDIQLLKYHIRRIMNELEDKSPYHGDFFHDIDALDLPKSVPNTIEAGLDQALKVFLRKIKKNKLLSKNHVNAFLATVPPHDQEFRENYLVIQARLLLVAYDLSQQQGFGDFIERALRDYRMLIDKEKWEWLNKLPNFSLHISDLVGELGEVREKLPNSAKKRTLAFASLLKQYRKNKSNYTPRRVNRHTKAKAVLEKPFETIENKIAFEEDETSYIEFLPEVSDAETGIEYDEYVADQLAAKRFYKFTVVAPDKVKESLSLQLTAVKSVANHIQRREKMLISDFSFLTHYDVTTLIEHCFKNLIKDAHYCVLLIMLFTGKSLDEVIMSIDEIKLPSKPPFDKSAIFLFKPILPEHKVDSDMESSLDRSNGSVIQALPKEIRNCIIRYKNQLKKKEGITEEVKKTITMLNQNDSTNLTLVRITNYLMYYLNNRGVDSTELTLVQCKGLRQESGTYYYQKNAGELLSIHQNYIDDLMSRSSYSIKIIDKPSAKKVGSQLIVKQDQVLLLFDLMSKQLEELRAGDWKQMEQFHNLYVVYCIQLLNIATGHRPVRNPFEDITKFDLIAGTLFISDKEERSELAARIIVLPEIVIEQIKLYLQHLKKLESEIANISNISRAVIDKAITGNGPFFFFLNQIEVEPVIPSNLIVELENIFPLPLNWHRHFMRTWLRKNGFSGQLTNAWMGHLSAGSSGFSRFSGLSMFDLREISNSINSFLTSKLLIKTIQPWT